MNTDSGLYRVIKPMLDFLLAFLLLALVGWVILLCAAAIWLEDPHSPVFYVDTRVGKNNTHFKMYKLRTMKAACTGMDAPLESTLTKPGKLIRILSLDELPQLVNILCGDMSFIGPRPLLPRYEPYYTRTENLRHLVKPGITGLAQINGRANLNWDKRFAYDVIYVEHLSAKLDFAIALKTIVRILKKENVILSGDSAVTASFDDYRKRQLEEKILSDAL